jgi:hypothetical protein
MTLRSDGLVRSTRSSLRLCSNPLLSTIVIVFLSLDSGKCGGSRFNAPTDNSAIRCCRRRPARTSMRHTLPFHSVLRNMTSTKLIQKCNSPQIAVNIFYIFRISSCGFTVSQNHDFDLSMIFTEPIILRLLHMSRSFNYDRL